MPVYSSGRHQSSGPLVAGWAQARPVLCHNPLTMPPSLSPGFSLVTLSVGQSSLHHIARLVTTASDSPVVRNHDQAVISDVGVVSLCYWIPRTNFCLKVVQFTAKQRVVKLR